MGIATASQTIGPYWHLIDDTAWADLTRFGAEGEKIVVMGTLFDGVSSPVADAAVEIWQTSPEASGVFPAFGRCRTDMAGSFRFTTLKPGPVAGLGNTQQAPHVAITIFARGLLKALTTRLYFQDEPLNEIDPILSLIEDDRRRRTVLARRIGDAIWQMDIHLQGDNETVFMEI